MKKAAVTDDYLVMVGRLLIFIVVSLVIVYFFNLITTRIVSANDIYSTVIGTRILYGDNCLAYDDGFRINPGILDLKNFNDQRINECFSYGRMDLQGFNVSLFNNKSELLREIIFNNDVYENQQFCNLKDSKYRCGLINEFVLYKDGENVNSGLLRISVVTLDEQER